MKLALKDIKPFVRQGIIRSFVGARYDNIALKTRDSRLFYVMSGNGGIVIDGKAYPLTSGSIVLFQSGTEYRWDIGDMRLCTINFDYTFEAENITQRFAPVKTEEFNGLNLIPTYEFPDVKVLNSPIVLSGAFALGERIKELVIETHIKDDFRSELCSNLLKSIIINIIRKAEEKTVSYDKSGALITKKIIDYIQNHFTEDITNDDIAEYLNFNVSYMNRVFKKHTKTTIHQFLLEQRLDYAMEKLKTENTPVNEVALSAGFKDIPHFTKIFKKYVGKTPTEYRNSTENTLQS